MTTPRDEAGDRAAGNADHDHGDRIGDAEMRGRDAGGIGSRAEQGGVAERRHAAEAGHQIERQNQQGEADDAGEQREVVGKQEIPTAAATRMAAMPIEIALRRRGLALRQAVVAFR